MAFRRLTKCKYSPKVWDCNASHPKKFGKSGDSNLILHPFGEYIQQNQRKSFIEQR